METGRALILGAYEHAFAAVVSLHALMQEGAAAGFDDIERIERWAEVALDRMESLGTVLGCELGGAR